MKAARAPESEGNCQAWQNVSMKIQVFESPAQIGSRSIMLIDHTAHNLLLFTLFLCICVCHLGSCRHTMAAHACMHACMLCSIQLHSCHSHAQPEFGSTRGLAIFLLVAGRKLQAICY